MKKQLLYFIFGLALISFSNSITAQEPDTTDQLTDQEKVDLLCDCVNSLVDDLHPEFKNMIRDIDQMGQEEAGKKFTKYLEENPDEMEKILKDTETLDNYDRSMAQIEGCENLNAVLSEAGENGSAITLDEMEAQLNSKTECEFAAIFFRLGKKKGN